MGDVGGDLFGALIEQCVGGVHQRAAGVDNVVDQDADAAVDIADDIRHLGFAGPLAALIDDRERGVDPFGKPARAHHAADVGRHYDDFAQIEALPDIAGDHRRGKQIVGRDIEEALDLPGMQIERQHAVGAGMGDEIGDELGRDRGARSGFAILPRVTVVRNDRGDPPRRRAPQRVDDDQQFHQVIVGGIRGRLDHEDVRAAHVLQDFDEDFHVGKAPDHGFGHRRADVITDRLGQRRIGIAGDELDGSVLARHPQLSCAARLAPHNPGKSKPKVQEGLRHTVAARIAPDETKP